MVNVLLSPGATVFAGRVSTVPAAVFETSAVLRKLLGAVDAGVDAGVEADADVAAGSVDELAELPPPHAASVSALALAASMAQLNRNLPMLKPSSSQRTSRPCAISAGRRRRRSKGAMKSSS
jgi:hypothetical protein